MTSSTRVGLFNEALAINEDYEHNYRIRRAGGRVFLAPDVRSVYYGRQSLRHLWRQQHSYGQWKARMLRLHPFSVRARHLVAPLLVLALAGLGLATVLGELTGARWRGRSQAALGSLLGLYTGALLHSSARMAEQRGWRLFPRLWLTFPALHIAWGTGFWRGLIRPPSPPPERKSPPPA